MQRDRKLTEARDGRVGVPTEFGVTISRESECGFGAILSGERFH
jgi:hypothetical protein